MPAAPEPAPVPAIVVVDDDEAARASIGQMLKLRRYRVETLPRRRWP